MRCLVALSAMDQLASISIQPAHPNTSDPSVPQTNPEAASGHPSTATYRLRDHASDQFASCLRVNFDCRVSPARRNHHIFSQHPSGPCSGVIIYGGYHGVRRIFSLHTTLIFHRSGSWEMASCQTNHATAASIGALLA